MGSLAVLEGYATAIAAPHLNAQGFSRLRAINEEMAQAIDALDILRVSERNQAFHKLIYDHCPNTHMRRQMEAIQERLTTLTRTVFTFIPTRGRVSLEEHAELVDLIEKGGDPLEVELLARTHKLHTVAAYEERLNNSGDGW
jgi:DNA-binding GntR family transcriptional regulator